MKTKRKQKKRLSLIFAVTIIIIIIACGFYLYSLMNKTSVPTPANQTTDNTSTQGSSPKPTTTTQSANEQQPTGEGKTTTISDTAPKVSVSITAANASNEIVQIRAIITGIVSNSGTCQLVLTKSGESITKTANTYALPNSSTCQGFDISRLELVNGIWAISLTATIGNQSATTTSEVVLK